MTEVPDKLTEGTGSRARTTDGSWPRPDREAEREPAAAGARPTPRWPRRARRGRARGRAGRRRPASGSSPCRARSCRRPPRPGSPRPTPGRRRGGRAREPCERLRPRSAVEARRARAAPPPPPPWRSRSRSRPWARGGASSPAGAPVTRPTRTSPTRTRRGAEERGDRARRRALPAAPRPGAFGSVWDSQIGQTPDPVGRVDPVRRRRGGGAGDPRVPDRRAAPRRRGRTRRRRSRRGGRGGRGGAYAGRDGPRALRRGGGGGGINRYPDVSGRGGGGAGRGREPRRDDRGPVEPPRRSVTRPATGRSDEPWSEVPPELEAMLRAQLAGRSERPGSGAGRRSPGRRGDAEAPGVEPGQDGRAEAGGPRRSSRRRPSPCRPMRLRPRSAGRRADPGRRRPSPLRPRRSSRARPPTPRPRRRSAGRRAGRRRPRPSAAPAEAGTAAPKRRTTTRKKADDPAVVAPAERAGEGGMAALTSRPVPAPSRRQPTLGDPRPAGARSLRWPRMVVGRGAARRPARRAAGRRQDDARPRPGRGACCARPPTRRLGRAGPVAPAGSSPPATTPTSTGSRPRVPAARS